MVFNVTTHKRNTNQSHNDIVPTPVMFTAALFIQPV